METRRPQDFLTMVVTIQASDITGAFRLNVFELETRKLQRIDSDTEVLSCGQERFNSLLRQRN